MRLCGKVIQQFKAESPQFAHSKVSLTYERTFKYGSNFSFRELDKISLISCCATAQMVHWNSKGGGGGGSSRFHAGLKASFVKCRHWVGFVRCIRKKIQIRDCQGSCPANSQLTCNWLYSCVSRSPYTRLRPLLRLRPLPTVVVTNRGSALP